MMTLVESDTEGRGFDEQLAAETEFLENRYFMT
jgi:hypothetical protein